MDAAQPASSGAELRAGVATGFAALANNVGVARPESRVSPGVGGFVFLQNNPMQSRILSADVR
jgi:hypothetical protein